MATLLRTLLDRPGARVEIEDVRALFTRRAQARWGARAPLTPEKFRRGVLVVRCSSPLWRTELAFHAEDLKAELLRDLPSLPLRRIAAVLI